jgi:hypothetical protein
VPSPAASFTIDNTVFDLLVLRTKLLHADEVRYMFFCCVGIRLVLGGLKIVNCIQYIVGVSRQDVLKRPHVTEMACRSVLFTRMTVPLTAVVILTTQ